MPGLTPRQALEKLTWEGAAPRYPEGVPGKVVAILTHELRLIEKLRYALLNAQPMGFYAPAQIVRDARDHGVDVRPVCVNASRFDCTLEPTDEEDGVGDRRWSRPGAEGRP